MRDVLAGTVGAILIHAKFHFPEQGRKVDLLLQVMSISMKKIIGIIISVLILLTPFVGVVTAAFGLPSQYDATFLGGLSDKYERLTSIDTPKIVVIGGSSVAFGLDSKQLEELTGMPVVNFGLYATLGTKCMIDLSKANINEGDIVILAPETDSQTMSLYFNAEAVWQALDQDFSMLRYIDIADMGELAGELWNFAQTKREYAVTNSAPVPTGIYSRESLDEYGDIIYERPFNVMNGDFDPTQIISFDESLLDEDFIEYVNDFSGWCESRGAKLYYSFSPMNSLAISEESTDEAIRDWYASLAASLDFEICSDVRAYIMDPQYFFDTNFHLNDTGVDIRTRQLASDILRIMGDTRTVSLFKPEAPKRPADYFGVQAPEDESGFFEYEENGETLTLVGITELGINEKELILPAQYKGKPVTAIAEGAFEGCEKLKKIIIPDYNALTLIYNGAFSGAPKLEEIHMESSCDGITVADDLMKGAPNGCMITVKHAYYGDYAGDYFWASYMKYIEIER